MDLLRATMIGYNAQSDTCDANYTLVDISF
jgi:hypothetical protein